MKKFLCWLLILSMLVGTCGALADTTVIMKKKSKGTAVKLLQKELKSLGYFSGKVDGIYGSGTVDAVREFRSNHNLSNKGSVDNNMVWELYKEQGKPKLKVGSASVAVFAAQRVLWVSGYLSQQPDGKFGKTTLSAAKAYMKAAKSKMTAFLKKKAANATPVPTELPRARQATSTPEPTAEFEVASDLDMPVVVDEPLPTAKPTAKPAASFKTNGVITANWFEFMLSGTMSYSKVLKKGDKGAAVKRMQKRLKALKYLGSYADGKFGTGTVRALKYFQYRNGLKQTGKLDVKTQKKLYSEDAKKSDEYVSAYKALVSRRKNKVWIYQWTGKGYTKLAKTFKCTTGAKSTPTKKGTFQAVGQAGVRWWHMEGCWVQWCFIIDGGYFFHSLLYTHKGAKRPTYGSVYNLGRNASHGCVRLELKNAKWIYDHCEPGMTVVIK